ncbi:MAG: LLM class flavin-dependent oxidoreductase [Miltoncostaeaceae bacterium]
MAAAGVNAAGGGDLPRIGLRLPQYGGGWSEIVAAARAGAERGVHSLWVNDHLMSPGRTPAEPAFDALTTLAALAPLVEGPRLGVAVLSATHRPAALAAKAATLIDVISSGRMVVGLGAGSHRAEHAAYGIRFPPGRERTAGALDALRVMRAMFGSPGGADLPGYLAGAPNLPGPVQAGGPPIWLAAHGPRLLAHAGREADGIVAAFAGPGEIARRLAIARSARPDGLPPLECALYTYALASASEAEAHRWLEPEAAHLGTTPAALVRWLRTTGIVGRPGELRAALAAHAAAGVTEAILVLPSRVPPESQEALLDAVAAPRGARAGGDTAASTPPAPLMPQGPGPRPAPASADERPHARHNLTHLLVGRWIDEGSGSRAAAVDDAGSWTYADLDGAAAHAAGALTRAGVRRGERVAVVLRDGRPWLAAFLGAARLGAVPVPLDPGGDPARLADVLDDCGPTAMVAEAEAARAVRTPEGCALLAPGDLPGGPPMAVAPVHPGDLAYLVYSSGSTGRPKGAMHSHADMRTGIETYAAQVLGLGPGDRCHSAARLFTSLGFGNGFFRVLGRGATAVFDPVAPTPRSVLGTLARHRVSVLTAVPTMWAQLARFLARHPQPEAFAGLRIGVSSGDTLPAPVARRLRNDLGVDLVEGLGCSECSNIVISTRPGEHMPGRLGRAVPGVEIRVADERGVAVGEGEPGRLWIRSDSNTSGYWRRPAATREVVFGPWLRMGDVLMERGGVYRHMGRSDDLFKVDARWVSPTAVEAVILDHEGVEEVGVVALPDEGGLARAAAFVVPTSGWLDERAQRSIRRRVSHALGHHCAPQRVVAVARLPRLPSGKLDRRRLREAESHGFTATP